jgi:hypothetical protein
MKLRTVLCAGVLASACTDRPTASEVDEQADRVAEARGTVARESNDVAKASAGLATAELDFATLRAEVVQTQRQRYRIHAIQAGVVRGLLGSATLSPAGRADAVERVLAFERELGEAEQAIDSLATATADQWDVAKTTVENAFDQLDSARRDAYHVISPT